MQMYLGNYTSIQHEVPTGHILMAPRTPLTPMKMFPAKLLVLMPLDTEVLSIHQLTTSRISHPAEAQMRKNL